jgi:hypothetical protein
MGSKDNIADRRSGGAFVLPLYKPVDFTSQLFQSIVTMVPGAAWADFVEAGRQFVAAQVIKSEVPPYEQNGQMIRIALIGSTSY